MMDRQSGEHDAGSARERLLRQAVEAGLPMHVAEDAAAVTVARFGSAWDRRATAYFWGCVRKRALRGEAPGASQRLVLAGLAAELVAAGREPGEVFAEMSRLWGAQVDPALLEPYRPREAQVA